MTDPGWLAAVIVGLGCAAGAVSRWAVDRALTTVVPGRFPWGTVAVNILGSLLLGLILTPLMDGAPASSMSAGTIPDSAVGLFLAVGYCGGLTTMSALSAHTALLGERRRWGSAVGLLAMTTVGSLMGFTLGWLLTGR
ncbi:MAG: CrcB family protein [Actinomycetales bacterium]|nr:CrcB family protein [Actinomycetales bacterium]